MTSSPTDDEGLRTFASQYARRRGAFGPKLAKFSRCSAFPCPVNARYFPGVFYSLRGGSENTRAEEFLAHAGGDFMSVDAALPLND